MVIKAQAELVVEAKKKAKQVDQAARNLKAVVKSKSNLKPRAYRKWRAKKAKLILEWDQRSTF
jgi:hypothetical protein